MSTTRKSAEHGSWEYSGEAHTGKFLLHFTSGQNCSWVDLQLQESLGKEKVNEVDIFTVIGEIHKILPLVSDVKQIN